MKRQALSVRRLSRLTGIDLASLRRLLRGVRRPTLETACKIAAAVRESLDNLAGLRKAKVAS